MSKYRVSKIKNNHHETLEETLFNNLKEAETFAQTSSLNDLKHFYVLEEKVEDEEFPDEDDYDDIKYYVNGEVGGRS